MKIKRLIKQIPFASHLISTRRRYRAIRELVRRIEHTNCSRGVQIATALKSLHRRLPQSDKYWQEKIEIERNRLLSRSEEPLVDGSLGEGGIYDDGVTIQDACRVSKAPKPALLLYLLTRALKPASVIELGTNIGISSAYIAAALKLSGRIGRCVSLDASPYRQRLARELHRNLGISDISYVEGLFTDTLHPCLRQLGSIDLAFIDGHHQYQPTLDYFEEILKFCTPDAVLVFDDIRWSDGMKKAWSQIQSDDRLGLIVDLSSVGICTRHQAPSHRFVSEPISAF